MPTHLKNDMPNATEQTLDESLREYTRLLQSYDRALADPTSLVLPLMAGVIARVLDLQQSEFVRAGLADEHFAPMAAEIVRAAEAGDQTLSAEAQSFLRPLILMGGTRLPNLLRTPNVLQILGVRRLAPSRVGSCFARWLRTGLVNPAVAVLLGCRFAENRLPRHPYPLLVASNGDLRLPLEQYLARLEVLDSADAALLGARTLSPDMLRIFYGVTLNYDSL